MSTYTATVSDNIHELILDIVEETDEEHSFDMLSMQSSEDFEVSERT